MPAISIKSALCLSDEFGQIAILPGLDPRHNLFSIFTPQEEPIAQELNRSIGLPVKH
ncbi:MAG TPA: hypothetical protein VFF59_07595 [Anaerolineae bacterium]|nr:hypothetical protein [Anaerolineae bacterium]